MRIELLWVNTRLFPRAVRLLPLPALLPPPALTRFPCASHLFITWGTCLRWSGTATWPQSDFSVFGYDFVNRTANTRLLAYRCRAHSHHIKHK